MKFSNFKKIVIKIGSSTIINEKSGNLNSRWLNSICKDIYELSNNNKKIAIVSSGAIALGKRIITNEKKIKRLEDKQAAAAVGQWPLAMQNNHLHILPMPNEPRIFEKLLDEDTITYVDPIKA